ncbi:MAG: PASTA domain-containing protein [Anaerolineae bacterium]|nr:PASTA domain-containing protein [Anaerolineae bacterium]
MWRATTIIMCVLILVVQAVQGQETVTVPDVRGLTVPAAAAALNRVGIGIGREIIQPWNTESELAQNTISTQSIAPDTQVEAGTVIDLTILRSPNTLLLYDDNDLTLVNQTNGVIDLTGITFQASDGNQAAFDASAWGNRLRRGRCAQIWSVHRGGPKALDECRAIEHWHTTTNSDEHFWTAEDGTSQFALTQNGIERGVCLVANPGRCELYLTTLGENSEVTTDHIYIAYTQDRLAILNNTDDRWMPLNGLELRNNAVEPRGAVIAPADSSIYAELNPVADLQRLAPGQCILFTDSSADTQTSPIPCEVIAHLQVGSSVRFWAADFPVVSATDSLDHTCPAATSEGITLCIMPR